MQLCGLVIGLGIWLCLTACANNVYPVTTGFYRSLPQQPNRVLVWATTHAEAETAVASWLQRRGLIIIGRRQLHEILEERFLRTPLRDERALLQAARSLGVETLVFVQASRMSAHVQEHTSDSSHDPMNTQPISVVIRGIDVKTGNEEWNARAFYSSEIKETDGAFTNLACQALATLWGFRPAGYHKVSSADMCHIHGPGQDSPPTTDDQQQLGRAGHTGIDRGMIAHRSKTVSMLWSFLKVG